MPIKAVLASSVTPLRTPKHAVGLSAVEQLANLFPKILRIHMPVKVSFPERKTNTDCDSILEFGTSSEALFSLKPPVEFGEKLRLVSTDGLLDVEADVVAIQMGDGEAAVAAKFNGNAQNWIIRK